MIKILALSLRNHITGFISFLFDIWIEALVLEAPSRTCPIVAYRNKGRKRLNTALHAIAGNAC